ncbi:MAG: hypothetical protein FWH26_07470 [Oscillospiraceae bacterium]|nr:hypothetical protein [Oscillospiraceae bacterium]
MSQWTVLGQLRLLTELDDDTAREALPFCNAALAQLRPQLKRPVYAEDPRVDRAAACMAYCTMLLRETAAGEEDISTFKAGDITVTKQGTAQLTKQRLEQAEQLRVAALEAIRELLRDTGFGVHGAIWKRR